MWHDPGGRALNFGLRAMCHQKDPTFFTRFHRKTPIFTNFHSMTPYFSKILTFLTKCGHFGPESPYFWCISLKDPLFLCALSLKDPFLTQFVTERPLHLRCLVALVRHFHMQGRIHVLILSYRLKELISAPSFYISWIRPWYVSAPPPPPPPGHDQGEWVGCREYWFWVTG